MKIKKNEYVSNMREAGKGSPRKFCEEELTEEEFNIWKHKKVKEKEAMINFLGKVLYMKGNVIIAHFLTQSNTCTVIIIENKN